MKVKNKDKVNTRGKLTYLLIGIIFICSIVTFSPSISYDFVNWDDDKYIIENEAIKQLSAANIEKFFSDFYVGHYQPLTILSYALQFNFFGLNPKAFHIFGLVLHLLNALLVYLILFALSKNKITGFIVAILFALHPMHVEPVVWISSQKDLLYSLFYLGALYAYLKYLQSNYRSSYMLLSILLFILSLLSKTAAVTLPLILLLIDYFMHRKVTKRLIFEKIPFFLLSLIFGVLTLYALEAQENIYDLSNVYSLTDRIILPFFALIFYISKCIFPSNLSAAYFFDEKVNGLLPYYYYLAPIFVIALVVLIIRSAKNNRMFVFGSSFFLVQLFLFLQIVPSGRVFAADRYSYLSFIGLFIILAHIVQHIISGDYRWAKKAKPLVYPVLAILLIGCIVLSRKRATIWENGEALFTDMIDQNPGKAIPLVNRGLAKYYGYTKDHRISYDGALSDLNKALSIDSVNIKAIFNRGNCYYNLGEVNKAFLDYNKVIRLDSLHARSFNNRGLAKAYFGNWDAAITDYTEALRIKVDYADALNNRGIAYYSVQKSEMACKDWSRAAELGNNQSVSLMKQVCKP